MGNSIRVNQQLIKEGRLAKLCIVRLITIASKNKFLKIKQNLLQFMILQEKEDYEQGMICKSVKLCAV